MIQNKTELWKVTQRWYLRGRVVLTIRARVGNVPIIHREGIPSRSPRIRAKVTYWSPSELLRRKERACMHGLQLRTNILWDHR